jgi:iron complex outermembrane receptor protein
VFQPAFQPEKIWDYEAGLKSTVLGGRLQANVAVFDYNYSNLQVSIVQGTQVIIQNAAKATLYGGELQLVALPTPALRLDTAISTLHSEYKDYKTLDPANPQNGPQSLAGNQLTQAPKFTVNAGAEYTWHASSGSIALRGEYRWVDDIYFTPFDTKNAWTPRHGIGNAYLNFRSKSERWGATVYVRNVTDKVVVADAYNTTLLIGTPVNVNLEPPRTYGLRVGYSF